MPAASLASAEFEADETDEDLVMGWEVEAPFPEAITSASEFVGGAPEFEDGEVFLDGCLLGKRASESSLGDAVAVGGRDGLSVPAAAGWVLGAMACVTADAAALTERGRGTTGRGADLVQCSRRRENGRDG